MRWDDDPADLIVESEDDADAPELEEDLDGEPEVDGAREHEEHGGAPEAHDEEALLAADQADVSGVDTEEVRGD